MTGRDDDDRDAIDRAFAELVAHYYLTADHPDPLAPPAERPSLTAAAADLSDPPVGVPLVGDRPAEPAAPPAPVFEPPPAPAAPPEQQSATDPSEENEDDPYEPEPLPPLRRPGVPAMIGWLGVSYGVIVVVAATFGLRLPTWAGWLAVGSFVAGFAVLVTQLPREHPPDSGNGAVV